ncbi:MAG: prepilin-type N-terminal cleavage/methylation domain-containing protein [Planctomycetota bacterium]
MQRAFTLIELVVALSILALLTGVASMSLRGHLNKSKKTRAYETLREMDRLARTFAMQNDVQGLTLNIESATISIKASGAGGKSAQRVRSLPNGVAGVLESGFSGQRRLSTLNGVSFQAKGYSPSYVVRVNFAKDEFWFVALGRSGQCLLLEKRGDVEALFDAK